MSNNFTNAVLEAQVLIAHAIGIARDKLILNDDIIVTEDQYNKIMCFVDMRLSYVPISQIIGKREFWGLDISINQDVLDPRQDTETLIDAVINIFKNKLQPISVIDIGTGSGCIVAAISKEYKNSHGIAIDVNVKSIYVALDNFKKLLITNRFYALNLSWSAINRAIKHKFDLIVSNPPYIRSLDIDSLQNEVKIHEPIKALNGGSNGINPFIDIFKILKNIMHKKSICVFEIGINQEKILLFFIKNYGFKLIELHRDLSGNIRCISFMIKN